MGCNCGSNRKRTVASPRPRSLSVPAEAAPKTLTTWTVTIDDEVTTFYTLYQAREFARANGGVVQTVKVPV